MPTVLNNSGIVYPDATTQNTAIFGIGANQTWQDMTASRAVSTNYTNTGSLPIMISIVCTAGNGTADAQLYVDGILVQKYINNTNGTTIAATMTAIIPPGSVYSLVLTLLTINKWYELR